MGHRNSVGIYVREFVCLLDGFVSTRNPDIAVMERAIIRDMKKYTPVPSYEQVVPLPLEL